MEAKLLIEFVIYMGSLYFFLRMALIGFDKSKYKVKGKMKLYYKYGGLIGSFIMLIQLTYFFISIQ